jgi:hypothetical protein
MKIIIVFLLIFSIFTDFSSSSHETGESVSSCDSYSVCQGPDFHDANADHSNPDDCEHCHCHAGHIHTAVLESITTGLVTLTRPNYIQFPTYILFTVSDYNSRVIRPPIA